MSYMVILAGAQLSTFIGVMATWIFWAVWPIPLLDFKRPRSYVVKAGDTLTESLPFTLFPDKTYQVIVYGPNGFQGSSPETTKDPDLDISCLYEYALQDGRAFNRKRRNTH